MFPLNLGEISRCADECRLVDPSPTFRGEQKKTAFHSKADIRKIAAAGRA